MKLVSVIMNCFNGEKYVREAIDSVLNQKYENWELIFWDNQSSDSTSEIVNSYDDERIKYFLAPIFKPLGEARNLALEKSSGELIAFLDSDDIWYSEKILKQIDKFQDPEVGIVICDTIFFTDDADVKQLYKYEKPQIGNVFSKLCVHYNLSLETLMIRKSHLEKLDHWFDTRFDMIEEYDLVLRLAKICKLDYVDEVLAKWRIHNSSWTFQKMHKFPKERREMIEKFKNSDIDFEKKFPNELLALEIIATKEEAVIFYKMGQRLKAMKSLAPFIFKDKKIFLNFVMIFLPYSLYELIQAKRGHMALSEEGK